MSPVECTIDELNCLKCLEYFDIFKHPLTSLEVFRFSSEETSHDSIKASLQQLVADKVIYNYGQFYSLRDDQTLVSDRLRYQDLAKESLVMAKKYGSLIAKFPFVKGVYLSGSISKNVMHPDDDIDYFVICEEGRVWLCKFLLVLYKRIILKNNIKYFCLNYYISEEDLSIDEHNLFTSIELVTLLPVVNNELYMQLLADNSWYSNFLPNWPGQQKTPLVQGGVDKSRITKGFEFLLRGFVGRAIDSMVLRLSRFQYRLRFAQTNPEDFDLMFLANKKRSKAHASNNQNKFMIIYQNRIKKYGA